MGQGEKKKVRGWEGEKEGKRKPVVESSKLKADERR
jgi:hypothetical protein